ncbi:hypothetical protein D3C73_1660410 [compost metagenome]
MFVGEFEAGDSEMPAELRRHFRRQIPAIAMTRHGEGKGFALLGSGPVVADGLIAIIADAGQL